jgi:hypothetical protein
MRLAAESPNLTPLCIEVAHQHDCLEDMKEQIAELPDHVRDSIRKEMVTSSEARWRSARGWLTTLAAVIAAAAATWGASHP